MHYLRNKLITAVTLSFLSSTISMAATITPEDVMKIPFELDDASIPITHLDFDGRRQTFMIDTGASIALYLTRELMAQLPRLVLEPEKLRSTDLTGKVFIDDKFHIPQLSINGMLFKDVKGVSFTP